MGGVLPPGEERSARAGGPNGVLIISRGIDNKSAFHPNCDGREIGNWDRGN